MIKMLNSYTLEIDDIDKGLAEILEQLDLENNLLKNSVGIMICHSDCIETGLVKAICDAVPFDVVGSTTLGGGTAGVSSMIMMSLSVLTGDDVEFSTSFSPSIREEGIEDAFAKGYEDATNGYSEDPALVVPFMPLMLDIGGERFFNTLDKLAGGPPIFGTIVCDHVVPTYYTASTIYNGEASKERMSMVLLYGNVKPRFVVTNISDQNVQKQKAIITESEGSVLKKVNDMSLIDYMKTLGLAKGDGIEGMVAVPFLVDYNDGTKPLGRAIYLITPEGYAVCGAEMTEGATLSIGSLDHDDVLATAAENVSRAMSLPDVNALLMFPCLSRNVVLGADLLAEMNVVENIIDGKVPYLLCYSGGELSPVYDEEGNHNNRFHNFSYITCVL